MKLLIDRATEKGRNGDSAWPLWGMAMRLLQAVNLSSAVEC